MKIENYIDFRKAYEELKLEHQEFIDMDKIQLINECEPWFVDLIKFMEADEYNYPLLDPRIEYGNIFFSFGKDEELTESGYDNNFIGFTIVYNMLEDEIIGFYCES